MMDDSDPGMFELSGAALAALSSHWQEEQAIMGDYEALEAARNSASKLPDLFDSSATPRAPAVSTVDFRRVFKEDWQLSQFWYDNDTAKALGGGIAGLVNGTEKVGFVCCPTGFVALLNEDISTSNVYLLEKDLRFQVLTGSENFIEYDLNDKPVGKGMEHLRGQMDVLVVDPPFHSAASQRKTASICSYLLKPSGRLILLTGSTLADELPSIYSMDMQKTVMEIHHSGLGNLENEYACFVSFGDGKGVFEVVKK